MKHKILQIVLLMGLLGIFFISGKSITQAADYNTDPYPNGIGRDMDFMGLRVIGISYSVDGGVREYAYDVYDRDNGNWDYSHTKINDTHKETDATNVGDAEPIITVYNRSNNSGKHYQVHASRLRELVGDFSVVTNIYNRGELVRRKKEYSFMSYSLGMGLHSVMSYNELPIGDFSEEADSYAFNFYRPRALSDETEVAVQTGEGTLVNGGVAYYTEDGYYVKELPQASLEKEGYSVFFMGWYDAAEGGNQIQAGTWQASGTTLYARWNIVPNSYNVTCYDICGDSPAGKVLGQHTWKADFGTSVSAGAVKGDSTDIGAYYRGYSYNRDTTAVVSTEGAVVYRYFTEHHYQISFDGNGSTGGSMEVLRDCSYSGKVTLTGNCFQKELCITLDGNGEGVTCDTEKVYLNHRFLGWATSPDGQVKYSDGAKVTGLTDREENVTLYAVWSDERLTVKEKPDRLGYEFAGWAVTPEASGGLTQFSVKEDMTLYAVWKPGTAAYHVEYYKEKLDGHYELESSYTFQDTVNKRVEVTAEQNRYLGYYLDEQSSVVSGSVRPDGGLILTVFYTRNKNEISYDINGGEKTVLPDIEQKKYGEDLTITDVSGLKRAGYTFVGWSQEQDGKNQIYAPGETIKMPNHKLVLYAVWKPDSYKIILDENGAKTTGDRQTIHASYDEKFNLPSCRAEMAGYEFAGWNTEPDGTGISYSCDEKVQNLCSTGENSMTLYAQWKPLSFDITYDANTGSGMGSVKGQVRNTPYSYVNDSYVSKDIYYVDGHQFLGWNTKPDGSGIMFAAGENITGKLTSKKESTLYAIWRLAENTGFVIEITLEGTDSPAEILQCYGKTGEKVSDALERIYEKTLDGEEAEYFYQGYQVVNRAELDKVIEGDHSTRCSITVKKRKCFIDYGIYQQGVLSSSTKETDYEYQENVSLKEKLEFLGKEATVARYVDSRGNVYYPGESISLKKNLSLIPQFQILMHGGDDGKPTEDYCCWGKSYTLPEAEKPGYDFLGWYTKEGEFVGKEKESISGIDSVELFARWSEPLHYHITYDIEDQTLKILENKVSEYQYLTEVMLPGKNQVAVLAQGYEFAGWYIAGDEEQKIIDKIASGTYGDVTLKAKLVKVSQINPDENKNDDDKKEPGDDGTKTPDTGDAGKKPDQPADIKNNPGILSQKQDPNKKDIQGETEMKSGTVFWKNSIRYKIVSVKNGKYTVKVIGNRCRKKKLQIPSKVCYQGRSFRVTVIGKKAFQKNKKIRKIVIPSTVCTVETKAFANMKRLTQISFGRNVKKLGRKVCCKDVSLKKAVFKAGKIKYAGKDTFKGCKKLRKIGGLKKQGKKMLMR